MEWGSPGNFVWFWTVPAALGLFALSSWRKKALVRRFGEEALVARLVVSLSTRKRRIKRALWALALVCIVLALARPHFGKKETLVERRGLDVILAVDVSNSMLARDIEPSRLAKAKLELAGLVDRLKGDRIGIVAFAGEAFVQCPLTLDRGAAKLFLSTIDPSLVTLQGTSLSRAIDTVTGAFGGKEKEHRVAILLTDGEDHEGQAVEAARRAKAEGVRIFTIGIGTPDGRTIPEPGGFKKDRAGRVVVSKLNEEALRQIARETGGEYYRSTRGELEIERLVGQVRRLSSKDLGREMAVEYEENYSLFVWLALLCLAAELILSERREGTAPGEEPGGAPRRRLFGRAPSPKRRPAVPVAAVLAALSWPFLSGVAPLADLQNESGNRHYRQGRIGKAREAYESAHKADPASPEIAFNLGNAYYKVEALDRALAGYEQAARDETTPGLQAKAFYNLGNTLARRGENEKALEFYKQALRLDPADADAKHNLEILLRRQEEKKKEPPKQDKKDQQKQDPKQQQQNKDQKQDQGGGGGQSEDKQQQQPQNSPPQDQKQQGNTSQSSQGGPQDKKEDPNAEEERSPRSEKEGEGSEGSESEEGSQDGSGGQGQQKDTSKKDDQTGEGAEGREKQQGEGEEKQKQDSGRGEEDRDAGSGSEEERREQEAGEGQEKERQTSSGQGQEEGEEGPEGRAAGSAGKPGEEGQDKGRAAVQGSEGEAPKPKSAEDLRAEQILAALENQEQQVFRMSNEKNARRMGARVNERDW